MKRLTLIFALTSLFATPAFSQQSAPEISFESVPRPLKYSPDMNLGEVLGIAVNSEGHIVVLNHPGSPNAGPIWANSTTQLLEFNQNFTDDVPRWPVTTRSDPITSEITPFCVTSAESIRLLPCRDIPCILP